MENKLQQARILTEKYNQQHLLNFYEQLEQDKKEKLVEEILSIDFELIQSLYNNVGENSSEDLGKIDSLKPRDWEHFTQDEKHDLYQRGLSLIRAGQAAALLVAGGQGTRLGHDGPKGAYDIGLPSHKSLFQLQCERLINLSQKGGNYIPWYIMTSVENHSDTMAFFKENNYFGYPKDMIVFFSQGLLPMVDEQGKILLSDKYSINMGPNGNGGCFLALSHSGALEDMERRGIKWVMLYGVDNALVKVADPKFLGFADYCKAESASKAVKKISPQERVGVICYKDGRPSVVEYSELPEELTNAADHKGNLVFDNANIANHIFSLDFLKKCIDAKLPYHTAHKKASFIDDKGRVVAPEQPNAYKFELFLFDVFRLLDDMAVLTVKREEEFAPVKNKEGQDSPQSARQLMNNLHRKWLRGWGLEIEGMDNKQIEVSPLVSCDGEMPSLKEIDIQSGEDSIMVCPREN